MTQNLSAHAPATGRFRWTICALLFFATSINYIDRQILALLKPLLDGQLGWTNAQFGQVNAAFQAAYGIGLLGFGWFIDRFGTKVGYAVSLTAWSLAAMSHALVANVSGFVVARLALGLGEGGNFPSAIKVVAQWFPVRERALATSIFNSGSNVGAIVAPAVVPLIALNWGWQATFVVAGACGLLWLFFWIPLYELPERSRRVSASELTHIAQDDGGKVHVNIKGVAWGRLLRFRQTWSFVLAKFLTDPVWWFYLTWLPDYFKQTRGLDLKRSWLHLVSIYAIVTVLSIAGGWVTGFLSSRGYSVTRARKLGMLFFAACALPIVAVTRVGPWSAVCLIGIAGAAHQAWSANLFTTVSDMFPKHAVASVTGIGGLAGATAGMAFPILTGKLLDSFKAAGNVTSGYAVLFGACSGLYLVAFAIHHWCAPRFETLELG
jgi:ACS family hexuronate transporter-like MFS transporter